MFEEEVIAELRLLRQKIPPWRAAGLYADHLRPLDSLERREAERIGRALRRERDAWGERTRERVARERRRPWSEEERWTLRKRVWRERRDHERALLEARERALLGREQELGRLRTLHERWLCELRALEPSAAEWCDAQAAHRDEWGITPEMMDELHARRAQAAERHARALLERQELQAMLPTTSVGACGADAVARWLISALPERERPLAVVVARAALLIAGRERGST
jgi:hypothetical protein